MLVGIAAGKALAMTFLTEQAEDRKDNMITKITHKEMLVLDCPVQGEQRADDVWPAHPNGTQVSKDTWLIV